MRKFRKKQSKTKLSAGIKFKFLHRFEPDEEILTFSLVVHGPTNCLKLNQRDFQFAPT